MVLLMFTLDYKLQQFYNVGNPDTFCYCLRACLLMCDWVMYDFGVSLLVVMCDLDMFVVFCRR